MSAIRTSSTGERTEEWTRSPIASANSAPIDNDRNFVHDDWSDNHLKPTVTAALHLRAMHESNRFDAFWTFCSRRYRATHIVPLGLDRSHRARID